MVVQDEPEVGLVVVRQAVLLCRFCNVLEGLPAVVVLVLVYQVKQRRVG